MKYYRTPPRKTIGVKQGHYLNTPDAPRRYIRCQYCGFICDTERDRLTDTSGEIVTEYGYVFTRVTTDNEVRVTTSGDVRTTINHDYVGYHFPETIYRNIEVVHNCPACGAQYTKIVWEWTDG